MLQSMHPDVNPDAIDGYHPLDVLEVITERVRRFVAADALDPPNGPASEKRPPGMLIHLGRRLAEMKRDRDEYSIEALRPGWFSDLDILLVAASDAVWRFAHVASAVEAELASAREHLRRADEALANVPADADRETISATTSEANHCAFLVAALERVAARG